MNFENHESVEQFATLFDIHYLPQGMCLHRSLLEHGRPFRLWILCLDEEVEGALRRLCLPHVTLIPLAELETEALRRVKSDRGLGEYCWTLTPFLPEFVFLRMPEILRVTYLDADLFFFDSPRLLIEEFAKSGKHVLITEHAYAPEYRSSIRFGRFCVQFMTFRNTEPGRRVLRWWQERCLEWCFAREEDGKFGDQKYLDDWPERFSGEVHVLTQIEKALAPWNIAHISRTTGPVRPVFFHFHSFRLYKPHRIRLFSTFFIGSDNMWIYNIYIDTFRMVLEKMDAVGIRRAPLPLPKEPLFWLRRPKWLLEGRLRYASV